MDKLIDVDFMEVNGEESIIIPIKKNGIYRKDKKLNLPCDIIEQPNILYNQSHYVRVHWTKSHFAIMGSMGVLPPILGNLTAYKNTFKPKATYISELEKKMKRFNSICDDEKK